MKLLRYGAKGQEQPGILDQAGRIRSLAGLVPDIAGDTLSAAGARSAACGRSVGAAIGRR